MLLVPEITMKYQRIMKNSSMKIRMPMIIVKVPPLNGLNVIFFFFGVRFLTFLFVFNAVSTKESRALARGDV